jgi:hypothetical protein
MEKMIISSSRTKDLINVCPDALAQVLNGKRPCKLRRAESISHTLSLDKIGTLVLWTKDPRNILRHPELFAILRNLVQSGGQLYLHLTVTGFGSTFVEYGLPHYLDVRETVEQIFEDRLIFPNAVTLRFDPLLEVEVAPSMVLSNMGDPLFKKIVEAFATLGIMNFVTSYLIGLKDLPLRGYEKYDFVEKKFHRLGLRPIPHTLAEIKEHLYKMKRICDDYNVNFDVCCFPFDLGFEGSHGCINAHYFRYIYEFNYGYKPILDEVFLRKHNDVTGGQRGRCRCTFSRDIGYTPGFTFCYPKGIGCLYCYSQKNLNPQLAKKVLNEIKTLKKKPDVFLKEHPEYRSVLKSSWYD